MALACIDSISDKLNFIESNLGEKYRKLVKELELVLRFLRTFFVYATKWSNHESLSSSLCSVKNVVIQIEQELISLLCFGLEDRLSSDDMADKIIHFLIMIRSIKQGIIEEYSLSNTLLQSSCSPVPVADELMEFIDSLLENLYLLKCDKILNEESDLLSEQFDLLSEKLSFLNNFIRLGVFREVEQRQLEGFLIYCEVVAVNAAHLSYICWYYRTYDRKVLNGMLLKISKQVQKIKAIDTHVLKMYSQVLIASKLQESSHSLTTKAHKNIVGDFIDSLLGSLCEILYCGNSFMVTVKHRIGMLYEGLKFLRHIIKKPEKFDGLHEKTKDVFGAIVTYAGILIFSLHMHEMGKGWTSGMDISLSNFLEKIKPIKEEVAEKYPEKSTFNFPAATNELDFIDLLIKNLKKLTTCKVDSNSFAMDRFQEVQEDLVFFRSFLENIVVLCNQDENLQALWNRIIVVAYKVEFVLDSLMVGDVSYYSPLMLFNTVVEETKLVKTEALEIDATAYFFEAQEAAKTSSHLPSLSTVPKPKKVVVGFKDEALEIIDRLTRESKQLDIVSIVGMPGLGKTTLASKVYHDPKIESIFPTRAWCVVSQVYCMKDVLRDILVCIVPTDSNKYSEMDENDLTLELYQRLKRNKYVIVLDDVWGIEALNVLKSPFPDDKNGSRILLTSRCIEIGKPFPLRRLTDDESWELLQKLLALKEGYPPEHDVLGKQIARNCNGLPLAVVIIAGILVNPEKVDWEEVAERTNTKIVSDEEQCRNVLELSYSHLSNYLKPCFLYFGTFLEDQEIPVWKLIRLWMAEGFVQKNGLESLEDMAEDYIRALIRSNLVMIAKRNSMGGVKTCRVHDLLHEFCVAKAKEQNFLQFVHGYDEVVNFDEQYNNLRRLCIYSSRIPSVMSRPFCPHVRSLLFLSQSQGRQRYAMSDKLFILRLKLLRVLDFGKVYLDTFPVEIVVLVQLRYLAIEGPVKDIPSSIEDLSNLKTFVLIMPNFGYVSLPDTIWNMEKLKHLYVHGKSSGFVLSKYNLECSPHLYNLHTFANLRLHLGKRMEKIMRKFPYIRKLKCSVSTDLDEYIEASNNIVVMDFLSQLESLVLHLEYYSFLDLHCIDFHFPLNLKKLTLKRFSWSKIFAVGKLLNLEVLKLLNGETDYGLRKLPNVEVLKLLDGETDYEETDDGGETHDGETDYGETDDDGETHDGETDGIGKWEMKEGEFPFPKLKFLKLKSRDIVRWVGSGEHFPYLQKLVLKNCWSLKELPHCLENISTLELIEVRRCPKSLASLVRNIEKEQVSMGNEDLKICILEDF